MRLIDADAIFMKIDSMCDGCDSHNQVKCGSCYVDDCISALDDAPTIDAVPTVHAKWLEHGWITDLGNITIQGVKCSNCGNKKARPHNYCENCGARMDGE